MKTKLTLTTILAALTVLLGPRASARVNPLKQMIASGVRTEVMILFDTSGSMQESGGDCSGNDPAIDLSGDGWCTGHEMLGSADCPISSNLSPAAGMPPQCNSSSASSSRMFWAKRAVRNTLIGLSKKASFGFVIYKDGPYFRYYPAGGSSPLPVTIFLTKLEMSSAGSWTNGAAWSGGPAATFKGPDGTTLYTLLASKPNSLYQRPLGSSYVYLRHDYTSDVYDDGTDKWNYIGSYYSYEQKDGMNTASPTYFDSSGNITASSNATYQGPQFVSGGTTYVHHRYNYGSAGLPGVSDAQLMVPLLDDDGAKSSADFDAKTAEVLNRVNYGTNGGVMPHDSGGTNNRSMMEIAQRVFADRAAGTCSDPTIYPGGSCPYSSADPALACRKRVAVLLTDGASASGQEPQLTARDLYCQGCDDASDCKISGPDTSSGGNCDPATSNPIQTYAVGIDSTTSELNDTADYGDNGAKDFSKGAYLATNEADLKVAIADVLSSATAGDFATGAPGASTSGLTTSIGDWAILPSTEYPGWKGHLRAWDLTQDPAVEMWDAASELNGLANPYTRRIFTGHPEVDADADGILGDPIEILNNSGDWKAGDTVKIREAWSKVSSLPASLTDAQMQAFFQWLYGSGRAHRLGAIIRCTPATVGPPPTMSITDYATFAGNNGDRERLIYITSNDGLIHAFRTGEVADGGGTEVFAYIPPNALDGAYQVYKQGGQDTSPDNFKWVMTGSPRVGDVYDSDDDEAGTAFQPDTWFTQLVVAMGPHVHGMVALDITNPTDCSSDPCALRPTRPFNVRALIYENGGTVETTWKGGTNSVSHFGEAWSTPAMYQEVKSSTADSHLSVGSGYGADSSSDKYVSEAKGQYYFWYNEGRHIGKNPLDDNEHFHDPAGTKVDAAVLANTIAVLNDEDIEQPVIATYQADLVGNIVRFTAGEPKSSTTDVVLAKGTGQPFYYAPAALHIGGSATNEVVLAASSGSADEDDPPSPDIISHIYLTSEIDGGAGSGLYDIDCAIGTLKAGTCAGVTIDASVSTSDLPPADALPVGSPLLVKNDPGDGTERIEAFYLYYVPASGGGTCSVSAGTSYLVRISVDMTAGTTTVEDSTPVSGRTSGMMLAGGGTTVVLGKSGLGTGNQAKVDHLGVPVGGTPITANPPRLEYWKEVK